MPSVPILHVSYEFIRLPGNDLDQFTGGILAKTYGNTAFPNPPVSAVALAAGLKTYTDALADMADAGPSATAAKNIAKQALINLLRKVAVYVEEQSDNDLAILLSSGFRATSTSHAQSPLPRAVILKISFVASGSLRVDSETMSNVKSWEARWKPENAPDSAYQHASNLGAGRKMTLVGLPSLSRVTIQTRGVGGSTGYGDWSDPVTHPVT